MHSSRAKSGTMGRRSPARWRVRQRSALVGWQRGPVVDTAVDDGDGPVCFSAQADLVVGIGVTFLGVDALRHVTRRSERALAWLPIVLGAHLLTEVPVWWGLEGDLSESVWRPAMFVYLLIAFAVVPVLVPLAIAALEPVRRRRSSTAFVVLGAVVAVVLVHALVRGPVDAEIVGHHVAYRTGLWGGGAIVLLYVVATCGSLIASSHQRVRWFGAVNLVAVAVLVTIDKSALISLWCAWAAVISVAITWHLRITSSPGQPPSRALAGAG